MAVIILIIRISSIFRWKFWWNIVLIQQNGSPIHKTWSIQNSVLLNILVLFGESAWAALPNTRVFLFSILVFSSAAQAAQPGQTRIFGWTLIQKDHLGSWPIFGGVGLEVGNYKPGGRKVGTAADGKRGAVKSDERPLPPFFSPFDGLPAPWRWASSKQCILCGWEPFHPSCKGNGFVQCNNTNYYLFG